MDVTLTSMRMKIDLQADIAAIFSFALECDDDIAIACDDGRTFHARDGRIAVVADGDDGEEGAVMLVGDALMIAWESGVRTPFVDTDLLPA